MEEATYRVSLIVSGALEDDFDFTSFGEANAKYDELIDETRFMTPEDRGGYTVISLYDTVANANVASTDIGQYEGYDNVPPEQDEDPYDVYGAPFGEEQPIIDRMESYGEEYGPYEFGDYGY